jgi:mutator protein MutT
MIGDLLGSIWANIPKTLRRWSMRALNTRFTVTAAAVICNTERQVLLLKHLFRPGSGWGLPGGFMKAGEQPQEALRRELREEIGLEVEKLEIFSARTFSKPRQIEIIFLGSSNGQPQPQSMEVERAVWFATSSLPEGLPDDQRRLIERAVVNGANQGD